jgi:hypothetical protein
VAAIAQPGIIIPQRAPYGFVRSKDAYKGPDSGRVRDQIQLMQDLWLSYKPEEFISRFCWIQKKPHKEGEETFLPPELEFWNKNLVPFHYNNIQRNIESRLGKRNIFLKPRQAGYTTYSLLRRLFLPCILHPGENGLFISRNGKTAGDTFSMLKRCLLHFAEVDPYNKNENTFATALKQNMLHTTYSNRRELVFDQLDVAIRCDSAEDTEVGQGYTYTHIVADEVARWEHDPEETLANMKESIPSEGTLDLVSTANGHGGYFFEEAHRAKDVGKGYREFVYHFHTWNFHVEYTLDKNSISPPVTQENLTKEELLFIAAREEEKQTITLDQIAWRRKKKEELRFEFNEKYPEDDESCWLLTGGSYFDKEIMMHRYKELLASSPHEKYAKLQVYKPQKPHREYVIGADVASGLEVGTGDLDWSVAEVIDLETGEQVAEYRSQLLPEEFGWDLADLGERYNHALIAVERNNEGGTVILTLERACSYMNLYKHVDWHRRELPRRGKHQSNQQTRGRLRELLGFPTTNITRPLALNRFRYYLSEFPDKLHSVKLLEECSTFVRDQEKQGRPAADVGCHDDCVLAMAIAQYCRAVKLGYLPTETMPHREKYAEIPAEFRAEQDPE